MEKSKNRILLFVYKNYLIAIFRGLLDDKGKYK